MKSLPVDVIMLTNTANQQYYEMTRECIASLRVSEENTAFHIILVETNTHSPYVYDVDQLLVPNVKFHYNKYVNLALDYCTHDWVVISNNDLIYHENWFSAIELVHSANPRIQSFSPWDDNWHTSRIDKSSNVHFGYRTALQVTGWCLAIRKKVFDIIGKLDEHYAFHYQDDDYAMTLKEHGILHALVKGAKVTHLCNQSRELYGLKELRYDTDQVARPYFLKKWKQHSS